MIADNDGVLVLLKESLPQRTMTGKDGGKFGDLLLLSA